jgi:hypothetical protein
MTLDQREVLDLLAKDWKIRHVRRDWLLKESGQISSYANICGGEPTLCQLRDLGYIDARNAITEKGRAAIEYLQANFWLTARTQRGLRS